MSGDDQQPGPEPRGEGGDGWDTNREQDDWAVGATADLAEDDMAQLSRLRAQMGFRLIDGRYEILRTLGHGGMGVVYQVHDREMDSGEVALKLVRGSQFGDLARAQAKLRQEAQQMARLRNHPHIVTVLDVGVDAGSTYLTMEYVAGTDLRRWQGQQRRSIPEVLQAYLGAARGLVAAHDIGIVHRDFKPDNALIDSKGTVKVADFGIAAVRDSLIAEPSEGPGEKHTEIRGTVPYMSPEQMAGQRADARTDQFSFCVALWEALTGQLPYTWRDASTQKEALEGEPEHAKRVPAWLRGPLRRGMDAQRTARYGDMRELIALIERGLARPRRVKRALGASAGTLALGALVGLLVWNPPEPTCERFAATAADHWGEAQRSALERRRSVAPTSVDWAIVELDGLTRQWVQAAEDTCEGDQAPPLDSPERKCLESWQASFDQAVDLLVNRGDEKTLRRAPDLLARLEPPGGDFCAVDGRPTDPELAELVDGARGAAVLGDRDGAEHMSLAALERARDLAADERYTLDLAYAHAARGEVLSARGELEEASDEYLLAEEHAAGTNELGELARIRIFWARALALEPEHAKEAEGHLRRAKPLLVSAGLSDDSLLRGEFTEVRALTNEGLGALDEAAAGYTEAAEFFREVGSPILAARARGNRGVLNHGRGELAAAEADYRAAIETYLGAKVPPEYPRLLDAQYNLGLVLLARYYSSGDEAAVDEALDALESVIEHAPPRLRLTALGDACELAAGAKRTERLRTLITPALHELEKVTELDDATRDNVRLQLGRALLEGLEDSRGEELLGKLLARADELDTHTYWLLMPSWIEYLERSGRCDEALAATQQLRHPEEFEDLQTWKNQRPGEACQ